jgi:hypothetical protein
LALDPNMVRWIVASCRVFFAARRGSYSLFFENIGPKDLKDIHGQSIPLYGQFRIDGPYIHTPTKNEIWYDVEINILCQSVIDNRDSDLIEQMIGTFAAAYEYAIPVMKYGDNEGDDSTVQIGCLIQLLEKGEQIRVNRFGQANPDTKLAQASIDGSYRMRLF